MKNILIRNGIIVNEGRSFRGDLLITGDVISAIGEDLDTGNDVYAIDASGKLLLPGIIDDQVHFRDPGLTHKGDIFSESKAAAAGGVTSFMDMPNTVPNTITLSALNDKFSIASEKSLVNYSFYIGATNDNLAEILKTEPANVCGIKLFMGSSTGNMLVDNEQALERLFAEAHIPLTAHCEDEQEIKKNSAWYRNKYGENVPVTMHPLIRSRDACFISASYAVNLAKKTQYQAPHPSSLNSRRDEAFLK
jgi:dihydroorotase